MPEEPLSVKATAIDSYHAIKNSISRSVQLGNKKTFMCSVYDSLNEILVAK